MTSISILAMAAGLAILAFVPPTKDKRVSLATQVGGSFLFGTGLVGLVFGLFPHVV